MLFAFVHLDIDGVHLFVLSPLSNDIIWKLVPWYFRSRIFVLPYAFLSLVDTAGSLLRKKSIVHFALQFSAKGPKRSALWGYSDTYKLQIKVK